MKTGLNGVLKGGVFFLFFIQCVIISSLARADLNSLIDEHREEVSVITPLTGGEQDYGLLIMPRAEFSKQLKLTQADHLENDYYKVVENEANDALPVGDFDGDNVLYHLMRARDFYLKLAQQTGTPLTHFNEKIIVRVRMDHDFNSVKHFSEKLWYDNSCYITAHPEDGYQGEIWFYQRKVKWDKFDWYSLSLSSGSSVMTKNWLSLGNALPELVNKRNAGIDTAKIPDVIYHEAFHWATDYENVLAMPDSGNQVGEDYANFFGSSMIGRPRLADLKEFSSRFYSRHYNKVRPVEDDGASWNPQNYNAQGFIPSLFWSFRKKIGETRTNELIWRSLKFLKGGMFETLVPGAILNALHEQKNLNPEEVEFVELQIKRYAMSFVNLQKKSYAGLVISSDPNLVGFQSKLTDAAHYENEQIKALVEALKQEGIEITDADEKQFGLISEQLQTEARKPSFLRKVVQALANAGIKVGKGAAYTAGATAAALNMPVRFGSEFAVSAVTGHGLHDYHTESAGNEILAAGGGLGALYYLDVGLSAIGNPLPITLSLTGATLVESVICAKAKHSKKPQLKAFCERNQRMLSAIYGAANKSGDKTGESLHREILKITRVLRTEK